MRLSQFDGPSNSVDVCRLILLAIRRDTGRLTPIGRALLLALDRKAANGTEGR